MISQIYFWDKTLNVSESSSVHHQELAGRIRTSVLILLASCNCNPYDIYHCCVYSEKLLMMGRRTVRNT